MAGDPYKELGVSKGASADEVKKAYRKLAKELHPDKNPGDKITEDKFKRVTAAFDILGDKEKRAKYDAGQIDGDGNEQYRGFGGGGRAGGSPFGQGGNPFGQGGGPGLIVSGSLSFGIVTPIISSKYSRGSKQEFSMYFLLYSLIVLFYPMLCLKYHLTYCLNHKETIYYCIALNSKGV